MPRLYEGLVRAPELIVTRTTVETMPDALFSLCAFQATARQHSRPITRFPPRQQAYLSANKRPAEPLHAPAFCRHWLKCDDGRAGRSSIARRGSPPARAVLGRHDSASLESQEKFALC